MASAAVHIADWAEAIESGAIPGKFAEGRKSFEFPTLSYLGARGATHLWTIRVKLISGDDYVAISDEMLTSSLDGCRAEITVESQQLGGKVRDTVPTYVSAGKNLGKRNATNCLTQALRDALGLFNKQRKRSEAVDHVSAEAGQAGAHAASSEPAFDPRPPPMLVKKLGDSVEATLTPADFAAGVTVQRKLNGVHFVAFRDGRRLIRYSRTGTEYPGQEQLVSELLRLASVAPAVEPGAFGTSSEETAFEEGTVPYFDGELYLHGRPLNWISGQARRGDDEGALEFHIFDVFFPHARAAGFDMPSRARQEYLAAAFAAAAASGMALDHVKRVENFPVKSEAEMNALAARFLAEGYEGAIARKDAAGYRYGYSNYHSANLLKIKPVMDAEFPVVGFTQGTRGKDVGAVIWECEVPDGDPRDRGFTVVPRNMTYEERYALFRCLGEVVGGPGAPGLTRFERDIKGLPLTVEFREVSAKTGKPLQAKAVAFRTYEAGPAADPVRALLEECGAPPSGRPAV